MRRTPPRTIASAWDPVTCSRQYASVGSSNGNTIIVRVRNLAATSLVAALAVLSASCEKGSLTGPQVDSGLNVRGATAALPSVPASTPYSPTTQTPDQVKLCKDASSPPGNFLFLISATNTQAGDQVATTATLSAGHCVIIFNRTGHTTSFGSFAVLQITESGFPTSLARVKQVDLSDKDGTRTVTRSPAAGNFPAVSVKVNGYHGAVANFVNESFGVNPTLGTVQVCKDGPVIGAFTFTTTTSGTIVGDQVTGSISLHSGECGTVFFRATAGSPSASITVSEVPKAGTTLLQRSVRTSVTPLPGEISFGVTSVTVLQGAQSGKVITFVNVHNN